MLMKTILNHVEKHKSFTYGKTFIEPGADGEMLIFEVRHRRNSKGLCPQCQKQCPGYDTQPARDYQFVPLWGMPSLLRYAPRRVSCKEHGIHVELLPFATGKETLTKTYQAFLATWAKRLSWKEAAMVFKTTWESVYRSVKYIVNYGLEHRNWDDIKQLGVDEIAVFKGHNYLTCVYQLDLGSRRLLWCGKDRKTKTLLRFFHEFGKERCAKIEFVCTDMWTPFLKVVKKKCINALNILDRFHIMKKFGVAVDEVRREEVKKLHADKQENVLAKGRWILLKRPENLTDKQTCRLKELVKANLDSVKAYLMKEDFQRFWKYVSSYWADKFLEDWATRAMHSKLEPIKKVAKMLRSHKLLILNWFRAKGTLSSGPVEGLNTKAKLTIRKAYGFRTLGCLQIALYHQLGRLEEPPGTHRFC